MRTRPHLRLASGLVALSTILPTAAYADDRNMWTEGNDSLVTITGTTRTQIQWIVLGFVEGWLCRGGCRGGGGGVVAMVAVLGGGG